MTAHTGTSGTNLDVALLVEDHALLAESLAVALRLDGVELVRPVALDPASVVAAARRHRPAVVLLDLHLAEEATSLALIEPLSALGSRVVMLTGETDRALLGACVEAGAVGIVAKSESFDRLLAVVRDAVDGQPLLSAADRDDLLADLRRRRARDHERLAPFEALTRRERQVLAALIEGWPAERIATAGFVSMATVRSQIRAVLSKLGVSSQLGAVAVARAAGWTPAADERPPAVGPGGSTDQRP